MLRKVNESGSKASSKASKKPRKENPVGADQRAPRKKYKFLSSDDKVNMIADHESGTSLFELATIYGVDRATVYNNTREKRYLDHHHYYHYYAIINHIHYHCYSKGTLIAIHILILVLILI